ncbi:hypothetical protein KY290_002505 [Solanum tuberosum]|uniref:Uncharacterized protein n=1 Tax=Solanum tuberosum TaxID=4113 RepID=A0ABQ7WQ91_SOLTU|nr:hypothetical protein KY285_002432 [Solanum tuberosum]KAH0782907.1 hypothetical protein KY290_002505 [Solanum tuberosum]
MEMIERPKCWLEFGLDLLVKCGGMVMVLLGRSVQATLGGVLQKSSQQLNFILISPKPLKQLARLIKSSRWLLYRSG